MTSNDKVPPEVTRDFRKLVIALTPVVYGRFEQVKDSRLLGPHTEPSSYYMSARDPRYRTVTVVRLLYPESKDTTWAFRLTVTDGFRGYRDRLFAALQDAGGHLEDPTTRGNILIDFSVLVSLPLEEA